MDSKSSHIMNTSANLLGFTFFVLISMKGLGLSQHSIADKITGISVFLFSFSCFISFLSIKTTSEARANKYENIADLAFFIGVTLCTVLCFLILFNVVNL